MDRFIDDSGREVPISGVVEFARLLKDGTINAESLIYDGTTQRWFPARELPGFPALQATPPSGQSSEPQVENSLGVGDDAAVPVDGPIDESEQWRILHDGEVIGPVPESEVARMLGEGRLPADTKVQASDMLWPLPSNTLAAFRDVTDGGESEVRSDSHTELTNTAIATDVEEIYARPERSDTKSSARSNSVTKKALLSVPALLSGPVVVLLVSFTVYDFTVVAGLGTMAVISFGTMRAVWSG